MLLRRLLSCLLSVAIAAQPLYSVAAFSGDGSDGSPLDSDHAVSLLNEIRDLVDPSSLDLSALNDRLEWDPDLIVEFVREEIEFEQYAGLLRGAYGTLLDGAGNALDQSVLLATLLKDAGFDARIARTTLSDQGALALLSQMSPQRRQKMGSIVDPSRLEHLVGQIDHPEAVALLGGESASDSQFELVRNAANLLEKALEDHPNDDGSNSSTLIDEAKEYFWVQYRVGSDRSWRDVHPVLTVARPSELGALEPTSFIAAEVPEALLHQFRLRMFLEVREGNRLETTQIVPDWQRPTANLVGLSFSLFNVPEGLTGRSFEEDLVEAISGSQVLTPFFNGGLLPGTLGFDLDGQIYDLSIQQMDRFGATAVIRSTAQAAAKGLSALQGIGSSDDTPRRMRDVTAQWIEYTLILPGGRENTIRRYLFDRIGPAVRESRNVAEIRLDRPTPWELLAAESFSVVPGRLPQSLLVQEFANAQVFAAEAAEALSRGANPLREHAANALARTRGPDASAFFALIRLFDDGLEAHLPTHTYRHEPGIIATNWGVKADSGFVLSTDIISSNRRSRVWQGAAPARTSLIRQGVWETLSEANLLNTITASGAVPRTSFSVFEDAGYSPDALITLTPETETDVLSALAITPDERKLLQAALADGSYVVLLPGQDHERFAWWRLDPATFSAIGYLPNGRGATSVEYVIKLTLVVSYLMMGVLFLGATLKCLKHYANEALMCTGADIHWSNIVLTKNHKTRTEQDFSRCVLSQARFQPLPELECACGGIGEPVCP